MKVVSRFEVNLIRVLRSLVQQGPIEPVLAMLLKPLPRPRCLSRDAIELVQDALAKGCVHFLARRGWMRERFLRTDEISEGRLWQRVPPDQLGLTFSPHALEFLLQLVSGTLGSVVPKINDLTVGDRLLLCLALAALKNAPPAEEMRKKWLPLHQDGLCRLAFLEELSDSPQRFRIDWTVWTTGPGASIFETLQGWLTDRWLAVERKKLEHSTVAQMRRIGATQTRVYSEFLDALTQVRRFDLARSMLETARRLLQDRPTAQTWIGNLDLSRHRIADRRAIYQETLALLRQLERLQTWQQRAVGVSYFDEGYQASQLWKADWERFDGDQLCEQARAIVREAEPL